ncbi:MAG TPA: membrane protein insertase YidC [Streptosporangiaceae bacterium]|jgi:YidC/Oxa1 family membrane protein insertase
MSTFFGVPVDAAYHVVSLFAGAFAPLPGGLAAAAAIVAFTMAVRLLLLPLSYRAMRGLQAQARLAPMAAALRKKHARQPDRLQRELAALYRAEGTSMFAGFGPMLLQWPFLSVMYLLFRSPTVGGGANTLLRHDLLGAPLAGHWLGGAGPLSAQGAVFAGLFVLLALLGWLSYRVAKRGLARSAAPAGTTTGLLARLAPYITVVIAAFLPLAAGLYLATTTAWTLAERTMLRRRLGRAQTANRAPA